MFELACDFLSQLFEIMPQLIIIYISFDFIGGFFFNKR